MFYTYGLVTSNQSFSMVDFELPGLIPGNSPQTMGLPDLEKPGVFEMIHR